MLYLFCVLFGLLLEFALYLFVAWCLPVVSLLVYWFGVLGFSLFELILARFCGSLLILVVYLCYLLILLDYSLIIMYFVF